MCGSASRFRRLPQTKLGLRPKINGRSPIFLELRFRKVRDFPHIRRHSRIGVTVPAVRRGIPFARFCLKHVFFNAFGSFADSCVFVKTTRKKTNGGIMSTKSSKREEIDTGKDKRYIRRDEQGRFDEVVDEGRSLTQDRRQHSKHVVPPGQGDRGDQERRSS
jgi:hypothetical protein